MGVDLVSKNLEEFPQEVVRIFVDATNYVLGSVVLTAWSPEQMREFWRKRSLKQVLESGEINHLFPCIDSALVANFYFRNMGIESLLRILTDKNAFKGFKKKKSKVMHVDAVTEISYNGDKYSLNIGCGDINFLKLLKSGLQEHYLTTHPTEHYWDRAVVLSVSGKTLTENPNTPPLRFIHTNKNLVIVPQGISEQDYYVSNTVKGKNYLDTNLRHYSPEDPERDALKWLEANRENFPGLESFRYK